MTSRRGQIALVASLVSPPPSPPPAPLPSAIMLACCMGNRNMDLSSYVYGQSDPSVACAPVCPLGVCDSPEDATKPECADCGACYARGGTNDLEYNPTFLNDAQVAAAQAAIARGDVSSIKVHSDIEMNVQADWSVPDYAYSSTEITWLQLSTGELKTFNFSASTKCDYLSLTFSPTHPEKPGGQEDHVAELPQNKPAQRMRKKNKYI